MTDTIVIKVGGSATTHIDPSNTITYTGLSYSEGSDPANRGKVSTPRDGATNSKLTVSKSRSGNGSQPVTIQYNLDATALPGLRFAAIEWIGGNSLISTVSGGSITIEDTDENPKTYNFHIWFKDLHGVLKGRSQDPTIYNSAGTPTDYARQVRIARSLKARERRRRRRAAENGELGGEHRTMENETTVDRRRHEALLRR